MISLSPTQYDAWYATERDAWIGNIECQLLADLLQQ